MGQPAELPDIVNTRELTRSMSRILDEVGNGASKVIVRDGRMVALVQPIEEARLLSYIVEHTDRFHLLEEEGQRDLDAGRVHTAEEVELRRKGEGGRRTSAAT